MKGAAVQVWMLCMNATPAPTITIHSILECSSKHKRHAMLPRQSHYLLSPFHLMLEWNTRDLVWTSKCRVMNLVKVWYQVARMIKWTWFDFWFWWLYVATTPRMNSHKLTSLSYETPCSILNWLCRSMAEWDGTPILPMSRRWKRNDRLIFSSKLARKMLHLGPVLRRPSLGRLGSTQSWILEELANTFAHCR